MNRERIRTLLRKAMHEGLEPGRAGAAVFLGVFLGILPIYGLQSVAAIALAAVLGLNKPLTFAATFVNNPFLQPLLVVGGVQAGHILWTGRLEAHVLTLQELRELKFGREFGMWLVGSAALAVALGGAAGLATYAVLRVHAGAEMRRRGRRVVSLFRQSPVFDRRFIRFKLRLDRIFAILLREDLGTGPVVDLGCGYGIALALIADGGGRPLSGCDLDARRIEVAREALAPLRARLEVADIRSFALEEPGLVLILDVLQYLAAEEQRILLERCCAALKPNGKLIFRVPDRDSRLTMAFDRLIFRSSKASRPPVVLAASEYRGVLEGAGMAVRQRRFRNRLPLTHVLFVAERRGVL